MTVPGPPSTVYDSEGVDAVVSSASIALAEWLARPADQRRELVANLAVRLVGEAEQHTEDMIAADPVHGPELASILARGNRRIAALAGSEPSIHPGFRPGICVIVHHRGGARESFLPLAMANALLNDSVTLVWVRAGSGRLFNVAIDVAREIGLPEHAICVVGGDRETIDALVSHPLVATVLADGPPAEVAHVRALAGQFGKAFFDDQPTTSLVDEP